MKLGSGSCSSNEDVSRYQPFTQYCLRRENRSRTSGYTCTRQLCTAQTYGHTTHTWVGRRELAREWRVEMVLRRATSRPRWCSMNIFTDVLLSKGQLARRRGPCAPGNEAAHWTPRVFGLGKFKGCHYSIKNVSIGRYNDIICSFSSKTCSTNSAVDDPSLKARVLSTECHRGRTALIPRGFRNSIFLRL
jgi:hypothetical protein